MLQKSPPNIWQLFAADPATGDDREPWWPPFEHVPASTIRSRELRARCDRRDPFRPIPYFYLRDTTCQEIELTLKANADDCGKALSEREFKRRFADEVRRIVEKALLADKKSPKK